MKKGQRILSLFHLFWSEDRKALLIIWAASILVPGIRFITTILQLDTYDRVYSLEQLFVGSRITPFFYVMLTAVGILLFFHNYLRTNGKFYNDTVKRLPIKAGTYMMCKVIYTVLVFMITIGVLYCYLLLCNLLYHWILPKDCRIDGALFLCIARVKLLQIWFPWGSLAYFSKAVIFLMTMGTLLNLIPIELAKREGKGYIITGVCVGFILFLIYFYETPYVHWYLVSLQCYLLLSLKLRNEVKKA